MRCWAHHQPIGGEEPVSVFLAIGKLELARLPVKIRVAVQRAVQPLAAVRGAVIKSAALPVIARKNKARDGFTRLLSFFIVGGKRAQRRIRSDHGLAVRGEGRLRPRRPEHRHGRAHPWMHPTKTARNASTYQYSSCRRVPRPRWRGHRKNRDRGRRPLAKRQELTEAASRKSFPPCCAWCSPRRYRHRRRRFASSCRPPSHTCRLQPCARRSRRHSSPRRQKARRRRRHRHIARLDIKDGVVLLQVTGIQVLKTAFVHHISVDRHRQVCRECAYARC